MPCVEYYQVRCLSILTDQRQPLDLDGEVKGSPPVSIQAIPGAIRTFCDDPAVAGSTCRWFRHLHLPSCTPWLHRVLLHGFIATMGALTSAGSHLPTFPVSLGSFPFKGRYTFGGPGPLSEQRLPLL